MLRAATELICERGFSETRISDVAKRAGVSSALVIYYFGTRDRLLVDALRFSEEAFYEAAEAMLAEVASVRERISLLIDWTCIPSRDGEIPGAWGLWFDLWVQAFRHEEVKAGRVERDARWRRMIADAIESDDLHGKVDPSMFALEFAALLDGLSIQVALDDPEVNSKVAYDIAMRFAERELNLPVAVRRTRAKAHSAARSRNR
jgi:AcrR family transcriptional regulator